MTATLGRSNVIQPAEPVSSEGMRVARADVGSGSVASHANHSPEEVVPNLT